MISRQTLLTFILLWLVPSTAWPNLLRNASFQSDWLTRRAELKTLNWNYPEAFYNRRDYHPDAWLCRGNWSWLAPDARAGLRRLQLEGPQSHVSQAVNWVAIYDDRQITGSPDSGGYPVLRPYTSATALRMVGDLLLRVRIKGYDVAPDAGGITVSYTADDPTAYRVPEDIVGRATEAWPTGTYDWRWLDVRLPAEVWLEAIQARQETGMDQVPLPLSAWVQLEYLGAQGAVEVAEAQLLADEVGAPNLLPNGGFEAVGDAGYPRDWGPPGKYRYFPPRLYYIFNSWHHGASVNRGPVSVDPLIVHEGQYSLKMIVPPGDEKEVTSRPIVLNQTEPKAIEVQAWVKTDRLAMLQIDAVDQDGRRLDGFNWIQKSPYAIGTDAWHQIRQVFHPRHPLEHVSIRLAARGVNDYTLDDTGYQPQHNVVGTVWWDSIEVFEPETPVEELQPRGVTTIDAEPVVTAVHLTEVQLDDALLGRNVLRATLDGITEAGHYQLDWQMTSPSGQTYRFASAQRPIEPGEAVAFDVPYEITELTTQPYTFYQAVLAVVKDGREIASTPLWFGTWTHPMDLELGALYLLPEQPQMVRVNLGVSADTLATLDRVELSVLRRGTGGVLRQWSLPVSLETLAAQRTTIPSGLREDFRNLLLTDLDVSFLPPQPFHHPQRNWLVRAQLFDQNGQLVAAVNSQPFCRQDHEPSQAPIRTVDITNDNLLFINGRPWIPWGAIYGHAPVYAGPALPAPDDVQDLQTFPPYLVYDRFSRSAYNRHTYDLNALRYVAGSVGSREELEALWESDNLYSSTTFISPHPIWSIAELTEPFGDEGAMHAALRQWGQAPMVVATAPGIEEVFGLFTAATTSDLEGLQQVVNTLRMYTAKPVMVGHGGAWNRFEFERVPFFDIYDPETEPLYPANVHTDLWPLVQGQPKVIWLRPQIYEDVPYERWRFHTFVEMMRGVRGWQFAHGPGDASLFRGLHGEVEFFKPVVYSTASAPDVFTEPPLEVWSRRYQGRVYVIAASTHAVSLGHLETLADLDGVEHEAPMVSASEFAPNVTHTTKGDDQTSTAWRASGVHYLPLANAWPSGSYVVQQVALHAEHVPSGLVLLVKADGRLAPCGIVGGY